MRFIVFAVLCAAGAANAEIVSDLAKSLNVDDLLDIVSKIPGLDILKKLPDLTELISLFAALLANGNFVAMFAIILLIPIVVLVLLILALSFGPPPFPQIVKILVEALLSLLPGFGKLVPLLKLLDGTLSKTSESSGGLADTVGKLTSGLTDTLSS